MVYRGRRYFGAKSKNHGATMKQAVKEHPLGIFYTNRFQAYYKKNARDREEIRY